MSDRNAPLAEAGDIGAAFGLLTILPPPGEDSGRGARAAWAWPLAGLAVALIAAAFGWLLLKIGLPSGFAAAGVLAALALLTGALHEDGLADCADGLFGGATMERRLEIMKDSRNGSYATLALILSVLARWSALGVLIAAGHLFGPVVAAAVLSRAALPLALLAMEPARQDGLAHGLGRPPRAAAALGLILAVALALVWLGWGIFPAVAGVGVMAVAVALLAQLRIGGQTGDVLGAMQQMAELGCLAALCAAL